MRRTVFFALIALAGCGTLERQTLSINPGDTKAQVSAALGAPGDRQFNGNVEVWQYCQTGAGFGYHDFRTVWFRDGQVTAVTSYKDHSAASGCSGHFRPIDWQAQPP